MKCSPIGLAWAWRQYREREYQKQLKWSAITTTSTGTTLNWIVPVKLKIYAPRTRKGAKP